MTHHDVMAMVDEMGMESAYDHFAEGDAPDPPYVVFLYPKARNFAADGKVYFKVNRLNIELYTDLKDVELEQRVEAVLDEHGIFYAKSEVWIEEEGLYEVLYEMEV